MADILNHLNSVFTAIYTVEAAIKLIAFDFKYFKFLENIFDFAIVISSLIFLRISRNDEFNSGSSVAISLRCIRLIRLVNYSFKFESLKIIVETFLTTVPALVNVGSLLLLFVYIYGILCMNLLAEIKIQSPLGENLNF